ncbi:MAG: antirestriction protein [Deltaproteobacteria bacterium]
MTPKVKETLDKILARFESGEIPEAIAYTMFPIPNIPCSAWSFLNRTLVFLSGTMDARGMRQWNSVNRNVKKGSKALYILVPYMKNVEDDLVGDTQFKPLGFGVCPVFKVEDTLGEPLEYQNIELPEFPLMDRARDWGICIKAVPGNYRYYGYYSSGRKEIALATSQECVFFHELAHAGHHIIRGKLQPGQDPLQEIVAELSACALAKMVGKSLVDTTGSNFQYIKQYAEQLKMSVHSACLKVLSDTEKVLNLIIHNNIEGEVQNIA